MTTNNTTPTTVDELLSYIDAQLEMSETLHSYALKIDPNQFGYSNDIRILNVLKDLVLEKKESRCKT